MNNMEQGRTFWVVTELFFPEETSTAYIMTKISQHVARTRNVHVICGPSSYQESKIVATEGEELENIKITRVKARELDKDKLLQRILRLITLSLKLSFKLLNKAEKGDDVLLVTNPAPLLLLAVIICKIRGLKCYTIVHDVFPENMVAANLIKKDSIPYKILRRIFNNAYSKMMVLLVLGRDMKLLFEEKLGKYVPKPTIHVVENWADTETIMPESKDGNQLIRGLDIENKIIFQFAGNIGRVQGLIELFSIIRDVKNPLLHFLFIGEGALKKDLQQFIVLHDLKNISMLGSFPRSRQQEFLNATDVGIVSLQDDMLGLGVPSKTYNILAAGKPVLYIGDSAGEIGLMINEHNVGWCFKQQERQQLLDFFNGFSAASLNELTAKGERARDLAVNVYAKAIILDKYAKILTLE
jgi:glycosyltransferase involved in cell wall biosynthesis